VEKDFELPLLYMTSRSVVAIAGKDIGLATPWQILNTTKIDSRAVVRKSF